MLDLTTTRQDFSILSNSASSKQVYFDNACMSLKSQQVIDAITEYYTDYPACVGRSSHHLSKIAGDKVHAVRAKVARFINAKSEEEIIFTRNTTEAINLVARSLNFRVGDIIITSDKEHNSNLVPWQLICQQTGASLKILPSLPDNTFDLENFKSVVTGARLVTIGHTANLDGVTVPVKEIIQIAHAAGAEVLVDAAQAMLHHRIDVRDLDVDYLVFSGHKMLGPTGTGVLYGKAALLDKLQPFLVGGDTVESVTYSEHEFLPVPERFEAGLQDYAGLLGLGAAVDYLSALDFTAIREHEYQLNNYITTEALKLPKFRLIGPVDASKRSGIISFYFDGVDSHQVALMLDEMSGIMIRSGQHCVHSWFNHHDLKGSARVSLAFYNTMAEAQIFIQTLTKISQIF